MGSYKEIYEIEFITRTKQILNNYNKRKGGYKLTLLLNCLVSLIVLPKERTDFDKPPLWDAEVGEIPVLKKAKINPVWSDDKKHTLGEFVTKLRHGIAHQNIEPIKPVRSDDGQTIAFRFALVGVL